MSKKHDLSHNDEALLIINKIKKIQEEILSLNDFLAYNGSYSTHLERQHDNLRLCLDTTYKILLDELYKITNGYYP